MNGEFDALEDAGTGKAAPMGVDLVCTPQLLPWSHTPRVFAYSLALLPSPPAQPPLPSLPIHTPPATVTFAARFNDCLHYCLPGPVETWNDILYTAMMADHAT